MTILRLRPRSAAPAAVVPPSGAPEAAPSLAARRVTVGHSNKLTMDRFWLSSFLIVAIIWTALRDVPPTSKKLSFIPMRGRPKTRFQMFSNVACSVPAGTTSSAPSSGPFLSRRYASMAFASRSMSHKLSAIRCTGSDRSATPNPHPCRGGRVFHSSAQDPATQQQGVHPVAVGLRLIQHDADEPVIPKPVDHANDQTSGAVPLQIVPNFIFRPSDGREVELIGSERQLRHTSE